MKQRPSVSDTCVSAKTVLVVIETDIKPWMKIRVVKCYQIVTSYHIVRLQPPLDHNLGPRVRSNQLIDDEQRRSALSRGKLEIKFE